MAVRRTVRVLLPLAWVNSSLLSYGRMPYGTTIIAFGLGYVIFAIVWLYVVRREYYCFWLGLTHLCCYGASIIAFGSGYLMFATVWQYAVWREHYCL